MRHSTHAGLKARWKERQLEAGTRSMLEDIKATADSDLDEFDPERATFLWFSRGPGNRKPLWMLNNGVYAIMIRAAIRAHKPIYEIKINGRTHDLYHNELHARAIVTTIVAAAHVPAGQIVELYRIDTNRFDTKILLYTAITTQNGIRTVHYVRGQKVLERVR